MALLLGIVGCCLGVVALMAWVIRIVVDNRHRNKEQSIQLRLN